MACSDESRESTQNFETVAEEGEEQSSSDLEEENDSSENKEVNDFADQFIDQFKDLLGGGAGALSSSGLFDKVKDIFLEQEVLRVSNENKDEISEQVNLTEAEDEELGELDGISDLFGESNGLLDIFSGLLNKKND